MSNRPIWADPPSETSNSRTATRWASRWQWSRAWEGDPPHWEPGQVRGRLDDTLAAWWSWLEHAVAFAERHPQPDDGTVTVCGEPLHALHDADLVRLRRDRLGFCSRPSRSCRSSRPRRTSRHHLG